MIALLVRGHSWHGKFQRLLVLDQTVCIVVTYRAGELLRVVAEAVEFEDEMEILKLGNCCLDCAGLRYFPCYVAGLCTLCLLGCLSGHFA